MTEVAIAPLESVPEADILQLLRVSLGAEQLRTAEFWRWKHRDNPFGRSPGLVALDDAGQPVGIRVFLRWEFESPDGPVRAVRAVDTATHPEWRRRGLFRKLTLATLDRVRDEGVHLVFNTPNPTSLRGYLSMGWVEVGKLPLQIRPRRPIRLAYRRLRGGDDGPMDPVGLDRCEDMLETADLPTPESGGSTGAGMQTRRSRDFLKWRYADVPAFTYGALATSKGDARALGIFRLRGRSGARELGISELILSGGDESIRLGVGLCRRALRATDADYAVASAAEGTSERRCLRRAGFLPFRPPGRVLAVRPLQESLPCPDPRRWSSWCLSAGDLELF